MNMDYVILLSLTLQIGHCNIIIELTQLLKETRLDFQETDVLSFDSLQQKDSDLLEIFPLFENSRFYISMDEFRNSSCLRNVKDCGYRSGQYYESKVLLHTAVT